MPASCTICESPLRGTVDEALIAGDSFASISRLTSLSAPAIRRHNEAHLIRQPFDAPDRDRLRGHELARRWVDVLDDLDALRVSALGRGDSKGLLAVEQLKVTALSGYGDKFGGNVAVWHELEFASNALHGIAQLAREDRTFGERYIATLRRSNVEGTDHVAEVFGDFLKRTNKKEK